MSRLVYRDSEVEIRFNAPPGASGIGRALAMFEVIEDGRGFSVRNTVYGCEQFLCGSRALAERAAERLNAIVAAARPGGDDRHDA